jgi:hypothetical protein
VAAPTASTARRRLLVAAVVAVVLAAAVVGFGLLPWEWSFIDDGGLMTYSAAARETHGPVAGTWTYIETGWRYDFQWGLFRPVFWVWVPLFYLLPVGAAHAVRAGMLLAAVGGAVLAVSREFAGRQRWVMAVWTGVAVLAEASIYAGLYYPSIQELSGLCLIGLGLLVRRRPVLRLLAWTAAAWFKAPFAWLLLAYGLLLLWRRRERALGLAYTVLGAGTLVVLAGVARTGSYAQDHLSLTRHTLVLNLSMACGAGKTALVVVLLGAVLVGARFGLGGWRRPAAGEPAGPDPLAAAVLLGGLGYLANLVFWRTNSYYASGYLYLLTVGTLLAVRQIATLRATRLVAALLVPALVAAPTVRAGIRETWRHNQMVVGLRDCVLGLPGAPTVGYNRPEAWQRLDFIAHRADPAWPGRVVRVANGATTSTGVEPAADHVDYYIWEPGYGPGTPALMTGAVVCTVPYATVYRVAP